MKKIIFIIIILFSVNRANHGFGSFKSNALFADSTSTEIADVDTSKAIIDTTITEEKEIFIPRRYPRYINKIEKEFLLKQNEIKLNDYRGTPGILSLLPFSFYQDMGSYGQPGEMQLYGLGNGSSAYSAEGIGFNNRWKNSINTYFINSETIDSLEYLPVTSGFLYNKMNNPVQINIVGRNKILKRPYSRLRFHQAPNEEGSVDLIFNTPLFRNTYFYAQVSNSAAEPRGGTASTVNYNTDFSLWNVETSFSYLLNKTWVLEASYQHIKDSTEFNGGAINNANMFVARNATVVYRELFQRTTAHNFALKLNADLFEGAETFISAYYQYNLQEYRQNTNSNSIVANIPIINNDAEYTTTGINARQVFDYGFFTFDLLGNYERTEYELDIFGEIITEDVLSAGGRLSFNLFETFYPSFFAKTTNVRKVQYSGVGAEGRLSLTKNISLFGGLSFFESPYSILESELMLDGNNNSKQKNTSLELKGSYNTNNLSATAGYFYYKNDAAALPVINNYSDTLTINEVDYFVPSEVERSGVNFSLSLNFWKLLITTNSSYYFGKSNNMNNSLPDFTSNIGVYFVDSLFQSNLFLKAGANIKIIGEKAFVSVDHEKSLLSAYNSIGQSYNISPISNEKIPLSKQIDLFVAGTIQQNATIYIVFENLLDEKYYLLPYYPMYPQGLRFGVSWEFLD